jgi:S1-C subfamily serine protease
VIGVNDQIESQSGSSSSVGSAIPIDLVQRIEPVLIRSGKEQNITVTLGVRRDQSTLCVDRMHGLGADGS